MREVVEKKIYLSKEDVKEILASYFGVNEWDVEISIWSDWQYGDKGVDFIIKK